MIVADPKVPGGERAKVLDLGIAKLSEQLRRPNEGRVRMQTGVIRDHGDAGLHVPGAVPQHRRPASRARFARAAPTWTRSWRS